MAKGRAAGPPSENPFELRINKRKHNVLGQKRKGEIGHRGQSRDAAIQLRRRTLQVCLESDPTRAIRALPARGGRALSAGWPARPARMEGGSC